MAINIDIIKNNKKFNISKKLCKDVFLAVLQYLKIETKYSVGFSITFDDDLRLLNKKHRNIDKSTNVLTFSLYNNKEELYKSFNELPLTLMGDVYFSFNVIKKEADEQNKTFYEHFTHLLIHSYLHLLTYDHFYDKERIEMENIEIDILNIFRISNPYYY
ncbi:MAG: rRNA maturation RNase YbeY [Rickettsiales bacterium]|nr:rRNA maturation RNase YbeY [Rickettsiales bacterium]